jgi:hypothetical protein
MSDDKIIKILQTGLETQPDFLSHTYQQGHEAANRGLHPADCLFDDGTVAADKWREAGAREAWRRHERA